MAFETAVIGGGISGLASAWRLAGLGHRVTLYEAEPALGGLAGTFRWRDRDLERFYHCILPSDRALLGLIDELGLGSELRWRRTRMGFIHRGSLYPLDGAWDLLRFAPLRLSERVRMGLIGLKARAAGMDPALDHVTAAEWLRGMAGDRAFEVLWKPLLSAKIGDRYASLPARWVTSRMQREKSVGPERKGCLTGGYRSLIDAFERGLGERQVAFRTSTAIEAIEDRGHGMALRLAGGARVAHDCVVATAPLPTFQRMTSGLKLDPGLAELALDMQGVVSAVFVMRVPLTRYYWTPFVDSGTQAQGMIEMSNLVPLERTHGRHLVYLVNYAHRDSEIFRTPEAELLQRYRADLERLFPGTPAEIEDEFLFRAPYVEPVWTLGYESRKPPTTILPGRLYLATTAQVYPLVNSWNSCCEVVEAMMPRLQAETAAAEAARWASA